MYIHVMYAKLYFKAQVEGGTSPSCSTTSGGKTREANALRKISENSYKIGGKFSTLQHDVHSKATTYIVYCIWPQIHEYLILQTNMYIFLKEK